MFLPPCKRSRSYVEHNANSSKILQVSEWSGNDYVKLNKNTIISGSAQRSLFKYPTCFRTEISFNNSINIIVPRQEKLEAKRKWSSMVSAVGQKTETLFLFGQISILMI